METHFILLSPRRFIWASFDVERHLVSSNYVRSVARHTFIFTYATIVSIRLSLAHVADYLTNGIVGTRRKAQDIQEQIRQDKRLMQWKYEGENREWLNEIIPDLDLHQSAKQCRQVLYSLLANDNQIPASIILLSTQARGSPSKYLTSVSRSSATPTFSPHAKTVHKFFNLCIWITRHDMAQFQKFSVNQKWTDLYHPLQSISFTYTIRFCGI